MEAYKQPPAGLSKPLREGQLLIYGLLRTFFSPFRRSVRPAA